MIVAKTLFISKKILTPILKLEAYKKAPLMSKHLLSIIFFWFNHPVVPDTTGNPMSRHRLILLKAASGVLNSIATSAHCKSLGLNS